MSYDFFCKALFPFRAIFFLILGRGMRISIDKTSLFPEELPMIIPATAADDRDLRWFRNLRDRDFEEEGLFLCEGRFLTERLLQSPLRVRSLLAEESKVASLAPLVPEEVPLISVPKSLIEEIVGFDFHRGILALGHCPEEFPLEELVSPLMKRGRGRLVICSGVNNSENLGSIMRSARALGYDGLILGEECASPWSRRAVRVSMGAGFRLPVFVSPNLVSDLKSLPGEFRLMATVIDGDALSLEQLSSSSHTHLGLVLGSEASGIAPEVIAACHQRITIPMAPGSDSLNLGVAAGIFLHALK